MTQLPDKPSDLLQIAIADLEAVERDPHYRVDMGTWHIPTRTPKGNLCTVCFAGSVMARTLHASPGQRLVPYEFGARNSQKLRALNYIRVGAIANGFLSMGISLKDVPVGVPHDLHVPEYSRDPIGFKCMMKGLVVILKQHGL